METHHSHLNHEPGKKFSHYFYEFLMLFLAVSLGFVVENLRENYIEGHRAQEYSISLINDLKEDTISINEVQERLILFHAELDTLIALLKSPELKLIPPKKLNNLNLFAFADPRMSPNALTATEMKNSGSVRYFRNDSLKFLFALHDQHWTELISFYDGNLYITQQIRLSMAKLFDIRAMNISNFFDSTQIIKFNLQLPNDSLPLLSYDPELINQYANYCILKQKNWENFYGRLTIAKRITKKLINELKKEYPAQQE